MAKKKSSKIPQEIKNEADRMISNGLSEAIMGFNPGGMGVQLSQTDTLFKNNRWYLVSNMRQLLSEIYVEHGLVQTIVDVPVDDGMRGGVDIVSKQLSPEEIEKLQIEIERRDILSSVIGQAMKWNRLYGGAGVLIITDQDPETEFNIDAITDKTPLEFRAVDMWELFWDKQNTEGYNPELQEHEFTYYSYYGKKVHKSRVLVSKGIKPPSFVRPRLRGWGLSIVETLVRSINQYLKANTLTFEVLDEFKLDIYKIKNLTQTLMSADGTAQVSKRIQLANTQKNYQNAISMDSEDDYVQKQLSFSGLAEVMTGIRMQIASDMRMPLTKVFGISAAGFSSGEDDIENYNAMVESSIRSKAKYDILRVIEIMCQKMFGTVPDDLRIEFKPLRVLSSEQEENVKTQKFSRLLQCVQSGQMSTKEFKDACNKDNLLGVQLDTDLETIDTSPQDEEDSADKAPSGGMAPKSTIAAPTAKEVKNSAGNFKESEHPRDEDGKFGTKGGGSAGKPNPQQHAKKGDTTRTESERSGLVAPEQIAPENKHNRIDKGPYKELAQSGDYTKTKGASLSTSQVVSTIVMGQKELRDSVKPKMDLLGSDLKKSGISLIDEMCSQRAKDPASLVKKMNGKWKDKTLSEVTDLIGVRVVVEKLQDVRKVVNKLEIVTGFKAIEHNDFSITGNASGYRANHVLMRTPNGVIVEMQIQSKLQRLSQAFTHPIYKKDHGFEKFTDDQMMEVKEYSDKVAVYLSKIDQGKPAGDRPVAPKSIAGTKLDMDWKAAGLDK